MSNSGRSLLIFGVYTILNGVGLLLFPGPMLSLFGLEIPTEIWVRVAGWLICLLGFYYIAAGMLDLTPFVRLTVYGRASVFVFYAVLVAAALVSPAMLIVGAIDLIAAGWTGLALRGERQQSQ